jgi:hypothetical protein
MGSQGRITDKKERRSKAWASEQGGPCSIQVSREFWARTICSSPGESRLPLAVFPMRQAKRILLVVSQCDYDERTLPAESHQRELVDCSYFAYTERD